MPAPVPAWLRPLLVGATNAAVTPLFTAMREAARQGGRLGRIDGNPRRILLVAIGYLGDTLLGLPLYEAARARWPDAALDVWCRRASVELFARAPGISQVIASDDVATDRTRARAASWGRRGALAGRLRRGRYDLAIDTCGVPGTTLLLLAAGTGCMAGWSAQGLGAAYDLAVPYDVPGEHLYERRARLAAQLGLALAPVTKVRPQLPWLELPPPPAGCPRNFALLHVGAGWAAKCWPPERWGELARQLRDEGGLEPVLHHGPGEEALAARARAAAGAAPPRVARSSDLVELVAHVAAASVVVAADSGPGHLAAALDRPVVSLFGPTDPKTCRPLGAACHVVRAPSGRMADLRAREVLAALQAAANGGVTHGSRGG